MKLEVLSIDMYFFGVFYGISNWFSFLKLLLSLKRLKILQYRFPCIDECEEKYFHTLGEQKLAAMIALNKTLSHLEIGFKRNQYSNNSPIIHV